MTDWLDPPISRAKLVDPPAPPGSLKDHPARPWVAPLNKAIRAARGVEVAPTRSILDSLGRCFDEGQRIGLSPEDCLACLIHAGVHWHELPDEIVWVEARDTPTHDRHPFWREFSPGLMASRMGLLAKALGLEDKVLAAAAELARESDRVEDRRRLIERETARLTQALELRHDTTAYGTERDIAMADRALTEAGVDVAAWAKANAGPADLFVNATYAGKCEPGPTACLYQTKRRGRPTADVIELHPKRQR